MKTTVDRPDELLIAAKKHSAKERRPLRDLMARGLRAVCSRRDGSTARLPSAG